MRCAYCNSNKFIPRPKSEVWVEFAAAALAGLCANTYAERVLSAVNEADAMLAEYEKRFGHAGED